MRQDVPKTATGGGERPERDIWRTSGRGGGLSVTREGLLWSRGLVSDGLFSSPLRLSAYPPSHQSAGPLQHLSAAAFLRPVNHSHFTADRLMRLHKLRAPHMLGRGGGGEITTHEKWMEGRRVDMCRD